MSRVNAKIGILSKAFIFLSSAVVLCNYYYLYFSQFAEGESEGGLAFSLIKLAGAALLSLAILKPSIRLKYSQEEIALIALIFLALIIFSFKSALHGLSDVMFLNTIICLAPFLILKERVGSARTRIFYESCLFIITLQVAVDTYVLKNNLSIWENKAFIGGLGNPSSFGLVCNILIAYILLKRPARPSSVFYFAVMAFGIFMTSSMLSAITLVFTTLIWAALNISLKKIAYISIALLSILTLTINFASEHLIYKLNSITNIFSDNSTNEGSRSVSLRVEIHKIYVENITNNPLDGLLYGFSDSAYMKFDSQILTYLSSFGALFSLLFFLIVILLTLKLLTKKYHFEATCICLFLLTFATNRILDYYPLPLFFAMAILAIRKDTPSAKSSKHLATSEKSG